MFELDQNKLKFDDSDTWDLICAGDTIGVFQLESRIGRRYAKAARPRTIDELSDVIAIIRPGCLQSRLEDGRSLTDHYIARKQGIEEVEYIHPALGPILDKTVGIMVYQEQVIQIGKELAGMNDSDADLYLRYAIGKKKPELIEEGKKIFLDGCAANDIPEKDANLIFSWVEGCARYSFNASHSVTYAQHAYSAAYAKAHYPKEYFTVYLRHSKYRGIKKDIEKRLLIQDARRHNIDVYPYSVKHLNKEYDIIDDNIYVGFIDMKNCGERDWEKWSKWRDHHPCPDNWDEFLIDCSSCFNQGCMGNLIKGGGLDCYRFSRKKMLYQYGLYNQLNDRQKAWIAENYSGSILATLICMVSLGSGAKWPCYNKISLQKAEAVIKDWKTEAYGTWTESERLELWETDIIGAPITASRLDDNDAMVVPNIDCLGLSNLAKGTYGKFRVLCWITRVHQIKTKKNDDMAFISFSDGMFEIDDGIIFTEAFNKYKHNLIEDIEVMLVVKPSSRGGFVVEKVVEL